MILIPKKVVRDHKCYQKHGLTCTFTLMQTTKNMTLHACIARVQVLIFYVNTRLQILLKSPGLSVVSYPGNVLRHKQGRLTM